MERDPVKTGLDPRDGSTGLFSSEFHGFRVEKCPRCPVIFHVSGGSREDRAFALNRLIESHRCREAK
jgi:hypothetical protein